MLAFYLFTKLLFTKSYIFSDDIICGSHFPDFIWIDICFLLFLMDYMRLFCLPLLSSTWAFIRFKCNISNEMIITAFASSVPAENRSSVSPPQHISLATKSYLNFIQILFHISNPIAYQKFTKIRKLIYGRKQTKLSYYETKNLLNHQFYYYSIKREIYSKIKSLYKIF